MSPNTTTGNHHHQSRRLEGMGNPKIRSSTTTIDDLRGVDYYRIDDDAMLIAQLRREGRKDAANYFRNDYFYGRCKDNKICIWSDGQDSWLDKFSSGITWIGVHGKDSICMVTKAGDLDVSRVHGLSIYLKEDAVFRRFRRAVISEIEDLADPSSELRVKRKKSIKKPFGVVSVVPPSDKVHKASCRGEYEETKVIKLTLEGLTRDEISSDDDSDIDENDEDACLKHFAKLNVKSLRTTWNRKPFGYEETETIKFKQDRMRSAEMKRDEATINETVQESGDICDEIKAMKFLEKKMKKSAEDFTLDETVKTAIAAFRCLFDKKFKANEIEVSVMDPKYFVSADDYGKDIYVNHLATTEIEEYLSDMSDQEQWGLSEGNSIHPVLFGNHRAHMSREAVNASRKVMSVTKQPCQYRNMTCRYQFHRDHRQIRSMR